MVAIIVNQPCVFLISIIWQKEVILEESDDLLKFQCCAQNNYFKNYRIYFNLIH